MMWDVGTGRTETGKACPWLLVLLYWALVSSTMADTPVGGMIITEDTVWDLDGSPYVWNGGFTVASGATLTIEPGVTAKATAPSDFYIEGRVEGMDAHLELLGHNSPVIVAAGGTLVWSGGTITERFEAWVRVYSGGTAWLNGVSFLTGPDGYTPNVFFYVGANGVIECCHGVWKLSLHTGANVDVMNNDFSSGTLYAHDVPGGPFDVRNNWWGTTDPAEIATHIIDCNDDTLRPCVLYEPYLLAPPEECLDVLIVDQPGTTLWGNIDEYDAIRVIDGGSIVVPDAQWDGGTWIGGYLMLEADTIYVDSLSLIHADGVGFSSDPSDPDGLTDGGPGHGPDGGGVSGALSGGGAGFGGPGGSCQTTCQPGQAYGPETQDDTRVTHLFGSAGGDYIFDAGTPPFTIPYRAYGGRGGGYIRLNGANINVEGTVTANGASGEVSDPQHPTTWAGIGSGGGAGGQIVIDGDNVSITGVVQANGGDGSDPSYWASGGGGSGGRIKVFATSTFDCSGDISALGGIGGCGGDASGFSGNPHVPSIPSDAPIIAGLANDTGRDPADLVTFDPTTAGTAAPASTINLYVAGEVVGTGQADSSGDYQVSITGSVVDGVVEVTATAQTPCYSESAPSAPFTFTLDRVPPGVPSVPDLHPNSDTGRFDDDDVTRDWGPVFQGTCEPDTDIKLYESTTEVGTVYTADGNWQATSSSLSEGTHPVVATALDTAGNESNASGALSILVDVTDPVISNPVIPPTNCPHPGMIFDVQVTVTDALSGTQDATSPGAEIWLDDSLTDWFSLSAIGGSLFGDTWDSSGQVGGVYSVSFEAFDLAGNVQRLEDAATLCLAVPADLDEDGDVDLEDFSIFVGCMSGSGIPYAVGCDYADLDDEGDVDLRDFATFQVSMSQ